jgi:hypothetical protein
MALWIVPATKTITDIWCGTPPIVSHYRILPPPEVARAAVGRIAAIGTDRRLSENERLRIPLPTLSER